MNIRIENEYTEKVTLTDIHDLVERQVDGSDYESGQLEEMSRTIRNQTRLLAKVIEKLNLSDKELNEWFGQPGESLSKLPL